MTTERNPLEDLRKTLIGIVRQAEDDARERYYAAKLWHPDDMYLQAYWNGASDAYRFLYGEINTAIDNAQAAALPVPEPPAVATEPATSSDDDETAMFDSPPAEIQRDVDAYREKRTAPPPAARAVLLTAAQRKLLEQVMRLEAFKGDHWQKTARGEILLYKSNGAHPSTIKALVERGYLLPGKHAFAYNSTPAGRAALAGPGVRRE
jgi:hypothetical protein